MTGDKLEERFLYNSPNKTRFIRENYHREETREMIGYFFQKCYRCEKYAKTDLSQFTKENFISLFTKYFELVSQTPLDSNISYISKYQKWCTKELNITIQFDINKLSEHEKNMLIVMPNYLTREELYSIIDNPGYNARSKATIFMVYEGLAGKEDCEITHMKIEQLKGNNIEIPGERGRVILVPHKLICVLNEAYALTEIPKNIRGGKAKAKKSNLYDKGYILKNSHETKTALSSQRIGGMIKDILSDYSGKEVKNPIGFIETSGKLDYFKRLRSELAVETHEVRKDVYEKICYRYGMNKSRWASFKRLIIEIEDNKLVYNDSEHMAIVNSIFNYSPKNFTIEAGVIESEAIGDTQDDNDNDEGKECPDWLKVCAKMGLFGEMLVEQILSYEYKSVHNLSKKYMLGYDLKAYDYDDSQHYFEVKTSFKPRFYISSNELKKAEYYKDKYSIVFIHVNKQKQKVKSLEINNPISYFGIDYNLIVKRNEILTKSFLSASNFIIEINPSLLDNCEYISEDVLSKCSLSISSITDTSNEEKILVI